MAVISRTGILPLSDRAPGVLAFGPFAIADNIASARFEIARATAIDLTVWPDAGAQVQLDVEASINGVDWIYAGGCGSFGGLRGEPNTVLRVDFPARPNRQVRGTLTFIGGAVRTSLLVELHNPTFFDNANSVTGAAVANLTTAAWTIAGSNRLLLAGMGWADAVPATYSAVKWGGSGGVALDQVDTTLALSTISRLAMARLIAPVAASQTLYGELSGVANTITLGGSSLTGANQSTPLGPRVSNSATAQASPATAAANAVVSAVDDLVIAVSFGNTADGTGSSITVAVGAGQTQRWKQEPAGVSGSSSTEPGAASVDMTEVYTANLGTIDWGIIAASVKTAAAASSVSRRLMQRSASRVMILGRSN